MTTLLASMSILSGNFTTFTDNFFNLKKLYNDDIKIKLVAFDKPYTDALFVKDLIKNIFKNRKKFDYEIYLSSIYSLLAKEPKFSRYLKETMEKTATLSDYKLEGMASILESTLNGIIRLSEVVMDQYNELNIRIRELEGEDLIKNRLTSSIPSPEYASHNPLASKKTSSSTKIVSRKEARKARISLSEANLPMAIREPTRAPKGRESARIEGREKTIN